ncbi:sugar phosphate isomerase/epimerase [Chloroflexia bacterium SDU3-3]|nr:sugar phosphate isomerase/epimerase [Chloroflexia bacterium SDU3-3]
MADHRFTISAFGDEIDADLETQLRVLASEDIRAIELRSAWGINVLDLTADQLRESRALLDRHGFAVSAVGSPIGKSPIAQDAAFELGRLEQAIRACDALGTRNIRVFSYYVDEADPAASRDEVVARMGALAARAAAEGVTLFHENEKGIFGDIPARCRDILASVGSPALRMAFDPANFVQCGVRPMTEGWDALAEFTTHIHIKDAKLDTGYVTPAGEGDGELPQLLATLRERGYQGYLTLEPHLQFAGPSGGFSGEEGMRVAARALRGLLAR